MIFNSQYNFPGQLCHILQKTKSRINVLWRFSSTYTGVRFLVLWTFYIHRIRPIIDYSTMSLLNLTPAQVSSLKTIKNKCNRAILSAPRWTHNENQRQETRLVSLKARIDLMVANQAGKFISRPDSSQIGSIVCSIVFYPQDIPLHNIPWHRRVLNFLEELNLSQIMKERGYCKPHHAYSTPKRPPSSEAAYPGLKHSPPQQI